MKDTSIIVHLYFIIPHFARMFTTDTEMEGLRLLFRDLVLDVWNGHPVDGHGLRDGLMLVG